MSYKIFYESLRDHEYFISLDESPKSKLLAVFDVPDNKNIYKNSFGKTLIIGGSDGYLGAVIISGIAALRSGSRYVEICTTKEHHFLLPLYQPELLTSHDTKSLAEKFNIYKNFLIGPGLSSDNWSMQMFSKFKDLINHNLSHKNIIIDAGFLNILSNEPFRNDKWVLTPHIGEAACLLNTSKTTIKDNRLDSAKEIQKKYGGIVILKGHETIIQTHNDSYICKHGNSGMGTAGMGDCLAGTILSLISMVDEKNYNNAILFAVAIHSYAADRIMINKGKIGLLANDVINEINSLLNMKNKP